MKTKEHHKLGLTDEALYGLVDFYRELFRLDENPEGRKVRRTQQLLLSLFKYRIQLLKQKERNGLIRQSHKTKFQKDSSIFGII